MHQWLGVIHQLAKINVDLTPINSNKRSAQFYFGSDGLHRLLHTVSWVGAFGAY
jgi:hypothetical protein